jgi:EpsI family protein
MDTDSNSAAPGWRCRLLLPAISASSAIALVLAFILAAILSVIASPSLQVSRSFISLDDAVPKVFGEWKELPSALVQVSLSTGTDIGYPYDQIVTRVYQNSTGKIVFLSLAWGERQKQEVKIHRPELCYEAQGFVVKRLDNVQFGKLSDSVAVNGKQMFAVSNNENEAVSYWIRIGDVFSEDAFSTRLHIFQDGLKGIIPDGILVRASMRIRDENESDAAWGVLSEFLQALVANSPPQAREMLLGAKYGEAILSN